MNKEERIFFNLPYCNKDLMTSIKILDFKMINSVRSVYFLMSCSCAYFFSLYLPVVGGVYSVFHYEEFTISS